MSADKPSRMPLIIDGVWFRAPGGHIRAAYLKRDFERIFPEEWTAAELRAIADHMDRAPSAPAAGEGES